MTSGYSRLLHDRNCLIFRDLRQVYRIVRMIGEVTSAVQLCKDIHSSISQVKQTLFGNKKQQCEDLCNDTRFVENILKDLTKKINVNTDPGLLENVQNANKDLQKILTDVSEHTLKKYQLRKRHKLGKVISASNKSLQKVKENLKFAVEVTKQLTIVMKSTKAYRKPTNLQHSKKYQA
ncbi:uncharacterized protein [Apostichopus japonicus]|uniref:uncharacterized protein isoform X5 n=1 Tax=Stichopus japonicus TaxID=307972 RepID=UPI003AB4D5B9